MGKNGPKRRESSKAENCCNKCCEAVCRMSPWNQLICWCTIALCATGAAMLIIGGFAIEPNAPAQPNCGSITTMFGNGSTEVNDNPTVPLLQQNVYDWYLASTGIVVIIMIIFNCLCCASFVGLCCGLTCKTCVKAILVTGFVLFALMLLIYMVWIGGGTFLVFTFNGGALLQNHGVCRGIIVYLIMLYIYLVVLLAVMILTVVWCIRGKAKSSDFSKLQTVEKGRSRKSKK